MSVNELQSLPVDGMMHLVNKAGRTLCGIELAGRTAGAWPYPPCTVCDVQAGFVNERPRRRSRFVVRWAAVVTAIVALLVGACLGMAIQFGIDHAAVNEDALPPCATEDSTGCYWDADTMGNGMGNDLVTVSDLPYCTDEIAEAGGICQGALR